MRTIMTLLVASLWALPAAATQLDVKTGQWDMTAVVHMQGMMIPPDVLARMPPDARARIEGAMATAQQPHSSRSCLTEEKLRRGFDLDKDTKGKCQRELVNISSDAMEMRAVCKFGESSSTMHATIAAANRDTIHGTIDVDRAGGFGPQHMTVQIDGKWLGPDCDGTEDKH